MPVAGAHIANGERLTRTAGSQTTSYDYDALGNLRTARVADGTQVDYRSDGQNRRIETRLNGGPHRALLYRNGLKSVAEIATAMGAVTQFVYATSTNAPDMMIRGGSTYRLLTDDLGSVRLVVDTESGAIVQRIEYDEFGRVFQDTNPEFQPFGFATGIYDVHAQLVRFGARDYDPESGRWTAKDPLGLRGGANMYQYAAADPINDSDLTGLATFTCTQPLHALGGTGTRSGPDIPGNPFYHEYLCVTTPGGRLEGGVNE